MIARTNVNRESTASSVKSRHSQVHMHILQIFNVIFLENKASYDKIYDKILFCIFDLFFHLR